MTQHRVYFTETNHGYVICDSEEHAKAIQEQLDDGYPLEEVGGYIKLIDGERTHDYQIID